MMELQINLNPASELELRRQLYHRIRQLVADKQLQPGQRMPSSRDLADQVSVSRKTVKEAYRQLITEGFLESRPRSGTYVAAHVLGSGIGPRPRRNKAVDEAPGQLLVKRLSEYAKRVSAQPLVPGSNLADISFFSWQPVFSQYPPGNWQSMLLGEFKRSSASLGDVAEHPFGLNSVREEIARWVLQNREITCRPEQVAIVSGYGQALDLIARIHCGATDVVAMEDPTYPPGRELFESYGASILSVPVDAQGLRVDQLIAGPRSPAPKVLLITPAHQFPMGSVLTMQRRLDLINWAKHVNCLILEDDYDAEFNFEGQPVPALSALAHGGAALYLSSFKKILPPPFDLDFMIIPEQLVPIYAQALRLSAGQISPPIQSALAAFMSGGELEKQVRRLRTMYGKRRKALLAAIDGYFGANAELTADNVGLHVILRIKSKLSDKQLVERAAEVGVELVSTGPFYSVDPGDTGAFVLGYATLTEAEIDDGIKRLSRLLK